MRRVVVLVVAALVGAGFAGHFVNSSAATADGASLSQSALSAQLTVLSQNPGFACYLAAASGFSGTVGADYASASTAARWATLQLVGLRIEQYAAVNDDWNAATANLTLADSEYASDLTEAEGATQASSTTGAAPCPLTASAALRALPAWFRQTELLQYSATQAFELRLKDVIPLTLAGIRATYNADPSEYDTLCAILAVVPESSVTAFESAASKGDSATELVAKYNIDTQLTNGSIGCYPPSSADYTDLAQFTTGLALNTFSQPYGQATYEGVNCDYFLGLTKRETNSFKAVETAVYYNAVESNEAVASQNEESLLDASNISVSKNLGRWSAASAGILPPGHPAKTDTPNGGTGLAP
jgi:hypothetical protein